MQPQDDPPPAGHSGADETGFDPRPVAPGPRPAHQRPESRRIPPHGDVSPDGSRIWPRPSPGAKWLVWGGTALVAAVLTAGTVIAARHAVAALSGARPGPVRDRDARHLSDAADAPRGAPARPGPRRDPPRPGLVQEIEANTASLANAVENVMQALSAGMAGFRDVAGQSGAIMREFGDAASLAQDILGRKHPQAPPRHRRSEPPPDAPSRHDAPRPDDRHGAHLPELRDDPLRHDPTDGPDHAAPSDHDPRIHRL